MTIRTTRPVSSCKLLHRLAAAAFASRDVLRPSYAPNLPDSGLVSPGGNTEGEGLIVPNANVTYAGMQSAAGQLRAGEQAIEGDLSKLKRLVDTLVARGYVTDTQPAASLKR